MSLQAYQKAAQRTEDPRQTEYRLFGQVTRALMEADGLDKSEIGKRMDALDWNRRLWSVLGTDCALPGNGLPEGLRAQIISLSIWVNRHTSMVMRGQEDMTPLIEVNRLIMQGLMPRPEASSPSEAAFTGMVRSSLG
ncbi:MAG: flagellar biosynthesis regulator FlaF [Asticcacaulis sp.]